jgi:hypothetical protein
MKIDIAMNKTPAAAPILIAAAMPGFRARGLGSDISWGLFEAVAEGELSLVAEDVRLGGGDASSLEVKVVLLHSGPLEIPNCVENWYCPVTSSMSCKP